MNPRQRKKNFNRKKETIQKIIDASQKEFTLLEAAKRKLIENKNSSHSPQNSKIKFNNDFPKFTLSELIMPQQKINNKKSIMKITRIKYLVRCIIHLTAFLFFITCIPNIIFEFESLYAFFLFSEISIKMWKLRKKREYLSVKILKRLPVTKIIIFLVNLFSLIFKGRGDFFLPWCLVENLGKSVRIYQCLAIFVKIFNRTIFQTKEKLDKFLFYFLLVSYFYSCLVHLVEKEENVIFKSNYSLFNFMLFNLHGINQSMIHFEGNSNLNLMMSFILTVFVYYLVYFAFFNANRDYSKKTVLKCFFFGEFDRSSVLNFIKQNIFEIENNNNNQVEFIMIPYSQNKIYFYANENEYRKKEKNHLKIMTLKMFEKKLEDFVNNSVKIFVHHEMKLNLLKKNLRDFFFHWNKKNQLITLDNLEKYRNKEEFTLKNILTSATLKSSFFFLFITQIMYNFDKTLQFKNHFIYDYSKNFINTIGICDLPYFFFGKKISFLIKKILFLSSQKFSEETFPILVLGAVQNKIFKENNEILEENDKFIFISDALETKLNWLKNLTESEIMMNEFFEKKEEIKDLDIIQDTQLKSLLIFINNDDDALHLINLLQQEFQITIFTTHDSQLAFKSTGIISIIKGNFHDKKDLDKAQLHSMKKIFIHNSIDQISNFSVLSLYHHLLSLFLYSEIILDVKDLHLNFLKSHKSKLMNRHSSPLILREIISGKMLYTSWFMQFSIFQNVNPFFLDLIKKLTMKKILEIDITEQIKQNYKTIEGLLYQLIEKNLFPLGIVKNCRNDSMQNLFPFVEKYDMEIFNGGYFCCNFLNLKEELSLNSKVIIFKDEKREKENKIETSLLKNKFLIRDSGIEISNEDSPCNSKMLSTKLKERIIMKETLIETLKYAVEVNKKIKK